MCRKMARSQASVLFVLSVVVVLFALGAPIIADTQWTTNRLGLAVLLALAMVSGGVNGFTVKPHYILLPIIPVSVLVVVYIVSYVINPGGSVVPVVSWSLILGATVLLAAILEGERVDPGQLLEWLIVPTAAVTFLVPVLVIGGTGSIPELGFELRRLLDESSPVGLNRLLNGLTVSQLLCLIYVADGGVRKTSLVWLAIVSGLVFLLIAFAGGSRQTVVAIVFAFGLLAARETYSLMMSLRLRRVLIGIGAIVVAMLVVAVLGTEWFLERYYQVTVADLTRGSVRFEYYSRILALIDGNWLFGVGPGQHVVLAGNYPHNGYLGLLSEVGVVSAGCVGMTLLVALGCFIMVSAASGPRKLVMPRAKSSLVIIVATYFLIMVNLNDLLREYIGWLLVVLMVRAVMVEQDADEVATNGEHI